MILTQKVLSIFLFLSLFGIYGCTYNKIEAPKQGPCDQFIGRVCESKANVLYSNVVPVSENVGCNGCHDGSLLNAPKLNTHESISAYLSDCNKRAIFENSIKFTGVYPMPKGGPKMSDADINLLLNWICQGARR